MPSRSAATRATRKPSRSRRSHDARTALCSNATGDHTISETRRSGGPGHALHGEVVGLTSPGGEDDLAGARAEGAGDGFPSLLEGGLGGARWHAHPTGYRTCRPGRATWLRPPRAASGWSRRNRGRRSRASRRLILRATFRSPVSQSLRWRAKRDTRHERRRAVYPGSLRWRAKLRQRGDTRQERAAASRVPRLLCGGERSETLARSERPRAGYPGSQRATHKQERTARYPILRWRAKRDTRQERTATSRAISAVASEARHSPGANGHEPGIPARSERRMVRNRCHTPR